MHRHARQRQPGLDGGQVLHLAGRLTDEVVGFLGPASRALAEAGVRQILLAQDPEHRRLLDRLDASMELELIRHDITATGRWIHTLASVRRIVARVGPLTAVHLHGFVPGLLAPYALRRLGRDVPLVFRRTPQRR